MWQRIGLSPSQMLSRVRTPWSLGGHCFDQQHADAHIWRRLHSHWWVINLQLQAYVAVSAPSCCPLFAAAGTPYVQDAFGALLPPIDGRPSVANTYAALQASLNDDSTTLATLCPIMVRQGIPIKPAVRTASSAEQSHASLACIGRSKPRLSAWASK